MGMVLCLGVGVGWVGYLCVRCYRADCIVTLDMCVVGGGGI